MSSKDHAVLLVYMMRGFGDASKERKDIYQEHADTHGGHIGITKWMYDYAEWINDLVEEEFFDCTYPGVLEYEVGEDLGRWLFWRPEPSVRIFTEYVRGVLTNWFNSSVISSCASFPDPRAHSPYVVDASGNGPVSVDIRKVNSAHPVAEKKVESTMKIQDLISSLQRVYSEHGNVDVVVRGSTPKGFVDAQEVRPVKTPKRQTVYIGRATSTPQE